MQELRLFIEGYLHYFLAHQLLPLLQDLPRFYRHLEEVALSRADHYGLTMLSQAGGRYFVPEVLNNERVPYHSKCTRFCLY